MKADRREYAAARAAAQAAAEQDAKTRAEPEMVREHMWHVLPLIERQRAVRLAGLESARARNPLATFTDAERAAIRWAVERHIMEMSVLVQCVRPHNSDCFGLPRRDLH